MKRGNRIKELRKEKGMTADELGEKIGRDRATIYRYESERLKKMDVDILKRLADALGTTADYLNGEDAPAPKKRVRRIVITIEEEL